MKYIKMIKDMCDEIVTSVQTNEGVTSEFSYHYKFALIFNIKLMSPCTNDG